MAPQPIKVGNDGYLKQFGKFTSSRAAFCCDDATACNYQRTPALSISSARSICARLAVGRNAAKSS